MMFFRDIKNKGLQVRNLPKSCRNQRSTQLSRITAILLVVFCVASGIAFGQTPPPSQAEVTITFTNTNNKSLKFWVDFPLNSVKCEAWGGGGAGGSMFVNRHDEKLAGSGGGGAGGYVYKTYSLVYLNDTIKVEVGAGGKSVAATASSCATDAGNGLDGGHSSFLLISDNDTIKASGGSGGQFGGIFNSANSVPINCQNTEKQGTRGTSGFYDGTGGAADGWKDGADVGNLGNGSSEGIGGVGSGNPMGGDATAVPTSNAAGIPGNFPSGGGSGVGGSTTARGGNGANGQVVITANLDRPELEIQRGDLCAAGTKMDLAVKNTIQGVTYFLDTNGVQWRQFPASNILTNLTTVAASYTIRARYTMRNTGGTVSISGNDITHNGNNVFVRSEPIVIAIKPVIPTACIPSVTLCSGSRFAWNPADSVACSGSVLSAATTYTWTVSLSSQAEGVADSLVPKAVFSQTITPVFGTDSASIVKSYTYGVIPHWGNCDGDPVTLIIRVQRAPSANIITPSPICEGEKVRLLLEGKPPFTLNYTVDPSAGLPSSPWTFTDDDLQNTSTSSQLNAFWFVDIEAGSPGEFTFSLTEIKDNKCSTSFTSNP